MPTGKPCSKPTWSASCASRRGMAQPMLRQRRGSIVNISSRGSVTTSVADGVWGSAGGLARNQPYDASKAALTNLSFYLAEELRPHNIAVNVVFPAGTRTTGSDEMVAGRRAQGQTVGALLRPEHVVPLVVYLAQQDAGGETVKRSTRWPGTVPTATATAHAWLA